MKNKYLIVFFIGIVVLISILFIEQSVNKQDESTFAEEIVFRDFFSVLETQKIVIKWDSNSVLLERRDDGWYTGDGVVSYKADNSLIESIFSNLVKVKKTDVASNNPENYSNFGVDDSSGIFVELKKSDTETVSKFWIGNTTGSNATYFRMDGVSEVWLVSPSIRDFVRKTAGDFRDKKIMKVDIATLQQIVLSSRASASKKYAKFVKTGDTWSVDGVVAEKLDTAKVASAVDTFVALYAEGFVDDETLKKEYGLNPAQSVLTFVMQDGTTKEILFGNDVENLVYAKVSDIPQIFQISGALYRDKIFLDAQEYRTSF